MACVPAPEDPSQTPRSSDLSLSREIMANTRWYPNFITRALGRKQTSTAKSLRRNESKGGNDAYGLDISEEFLSINVMTELFSDLAMRNLQLWFKLLTEIYLIKFVIKVGIL